jgi:hypothetical protein
MSESDEHHIGALHERFRRSLPDIAREPWEP